MAWKKNQNQQRVQLNELYAIMAITRVLLRVRVRNDHIRNCQREPIVFEETDIDFSFDGKGEFEDEEIYVNFDEPPKFDVGDEDSIEERVLFGDDGHVIKVISQSTIPQVLETVVDNGVLDNYLIEKCVETKVKFARAKLFCSLNDDMDEELVVDVLQDSHDGVFVDNFSFEVKVSFEDKVFLGEFEDEEIYVNFDKPPKFDVGDEDFIEDRVVFGDDGHVIKVISQSASPQVLEIVVDNGVEDNYLIEKSFEVNVSFEDEVVLGQKMREGTKI
ncbi:hypothetical protein Sjap_001444 [Stephania japonica]|uniref:Uncharacterized protein n=1 Tax=Stephania japonica TaxID=461633 RepID=A0AAP0KLQ0_9MAGN